MNLRDLEYVLALAETGHFGAAASRCGVTQPTLSMQLARLESELGVQIFERGAGGVLTTERGKLIIAQAGIVLNEARHLQQIARGSGDFFSRPLTLGIIPTAGPYLLSHVLPLLKHWHPKLSLYVKEGLTSNLLERVRHAQIDAIITSRPIDEAGIQAEPLLTEEFVLAMPPAHRLAEKTVVGVDQLAGENMLLLEEGHCMRKQTQAICRRLRGSRTAPFEAGGIESLRQMVSAGIGCTLLPYLASVGPFATTIPAVYRPLADKPPSRVLVLAWRKKFPFATSLRRLAKMLREELPRQIAARK